MDDLTPKKSWTEDYPSDVVVLLKRMSFSDGANVVLGGSASIRGMLYAGDYDAVEVVKRPTPQKFQTIIRNLLRTKDAYIGDIKCGEVKQWKVFPKNLRVKNGRIVGYKPGKIQERLRTLASQGVFTAEGLKEAEALVVHHPTKEQYFRMRDELRPEVVRWTPQEILRGEKTLQDGSTYTLAQGMKSDGLFKLDVIGFVSKNRYKEFSMIYLRKKQEWDLLDELKQDILLYSTLGKHFKAVKRMFSLARWEGNRKLLETLEPMLNGDEGILYSVISDVDTILYLYENKEQIPESKVKYEIDQFRDRLSNIYKDAVLLKKVPAFLNHITAIEKADSLKPKLEKFKADLEHQLELATKRKLRTLRLLPIPKEFLP